MNKIDGVYQNTIFLGRFKIVISEKRGEMNLIDHSSGVRNDNNHIFGSHYDYQRKTTSYSEGIKFFVLDANGILNFGFIGVNDCGSNSKIYFIGDFFPYTSKL